MKNQISKTSAQPREFSCSDREKSDLNYYRF